MTFGFENGKYFQVAKMLLTGQMGEAGFKVGEKVNELKFSFSLHTDMQ